MNNVIFADFVDSCQPLNPFALRALDSEYCVIHIQSSFLLCITRLQLLLSSRYNPHPSPPMGVLYWFPSSNCWSGEVPSSWIWFRSLQWVSTPSSRSSIQYAQIEGWFLLRWHHNSSSNQPSKFVTVCLVQMRCLSTLRSLEDMEDFKGDDNYDAQLSSKKYPMINNRLSLLSFSHPLISSFLNLRKYNSFQ